MRGSQYIIEMHVAKTPNEIKAPEDERPECTWVHEDREDEGQRKDHFKRGIGINACDHKSSIRGGFHHS